MSETVLPPHAGTHRVFAYGTLLIPAILEAVIGRRLAGRAASLPGYARFLIQGQTYPAIVAQAGSQTDGMLFDGISQAELQRLDRYEGEIYLRACVTVTFDSGATDEALAYVLSPDCGDQLTAAPWDRERFESQDAQRFLESLRG